MSIGDKIRSARLNKHMTQAEVAADKITRNMLSAIESGKASPSLETLYHIANKLDLKISYLLSEDIDESVYKKTHLMPEIKKAYVNGNYAYCISLIGQISDIDDELSYILAHCNFKLGVTAAMKGSFLTAEKRLLMASEYASKTVYDTKNIEYKIPLYMSFVKNVNAPLLDFDKDSFLQSMSDDSDFEFYKYVSNDWEFHFTNPLFEKHALAKNKIKERKYAEAIEILHEIEEERSMHEYNAYLMYGVYSDLDNCYKQILDFENAYKYVGKRLSMLEGFNS